MQVGVIGARHRGYEVIGVYRERSVGKLDAFKGRIIVIPGATNDREVIKNAVAECDGVLTVLAPWLTILCGRLEVESETSRAHD